ncbi:MFS transporter [Actinopolymorpha sp. B17G11]|uniref:MFS transporter n=1 Tax=Actinopolymorpha sp. B17G11 TaxID=3160861 RepID=UPI0032E45DA8
MSEDRWGVPTRLLATVVLGTLLNPLNSSMIAVALVPLQHEFDVGVATATWLVSGFYLAAAVGQPLMGRFVDLFGARRLFVGGLTLVCASCVLAPFAPGFWWLVGVRVLLAAGTSTAFPAALVLIRAAAMGNPDSTTAEPRPPAAALAFLSIAASTSAALGPVLGGFLVAFAGWEAVFLVNVPLTLAGIVLALRVLPQVPTRHAGDTSLLATVDLPGILLFSGTLTGLLVFVLSIEGGALWWLAVVVAGLAVLLVLRERSTATPFLDIRGLVANRGLSAVLGQQGGFNLVFYCVFFGLPLWLGSVRGFGADTVGLLVLPIAAMGVLMTPVAARLVRQRGSRATLVFGSLVLLLATVLVQVLSDATPIVVLVAVALLFGIPGGFNNLGLQSALYEASPGDRMGSSGGLFQTFRYLGAISATSVLGVVFEHDLSSAGLHRIGWIMTGVAVALVLLALLLRPRPSTPAPPPTAPVP